MSSKSHKTPIIVQGLFAQLGRDWGLWEPPHQGNGRSFHPPLTPEAPGETVSPETRALLRPGPPCLGLYGLSAASTQKQSISIYRSYILRARYTHSRSFLLDFLELCKYRIVPSANKDSFTFHSNSSIIFLPSPVALPGICGPRLSLSGKVDIASHSRSRPLASNCEVHCESFVHAFLSGSGSCLLFLEW